jgi:hypothetical protein
MPDMPRHFCLQRHVSLSLLPISPPATISSGWISPKVLVLFFILNHLVKRDSKVGYLDATDPATNPETRHTMSQLAASVILHPKLSQALALLATNIGRDKVGASREPRRRQMHRNG